MTPQGLRAAVAQMDGFHELYSDCFGRVEAREHSRVYVRGLLICDQRKTCEAIALRFAPTRDGKPPSRKQVQAVQNFLTESQWDYQRVQSKTQEIFAKKLVPSAASSPIGVVGVIDESGDKKSGEHSCGAAVQWYGCNGKTELCQIGVFLLAVVPQGSALLDLQLFLPEEWTKSKARRKKTGIPKQIKFRTKPQIAIEMIERTVANGHVKFDWITADSLYGKSGEFLESLEKQQQKYVIETACHITFWTRDPATEILPYSGHGPQPTRPSRDSVKSAEEIGKNLPESAWQPIKLREGSKGPVVAEFARVRVWSVRHTKPGPAAWLVFRRELDSPGMKYYVSNGDENVSLEVLALVIGTRWRVEEFFEDGKQYLGLADYEARGWNSWHHHMSLVGMAHLYVTLVRRDFRSDLPELSLDRAYRMLCDAMAHPRLTPDESLRITYYHLRYNSEASRSHRKAWVRRNKHTAQKLRL